MALIKCPECGKEISDKAVSCPNCGCPNSEFNKQKEPMPEEKPELFACVKCGRDISKNSQKCPFCGYSYGIYGKTNDNSERYNTQNQNVRKSSPIPGTSNEIAVYDARTVREPRFMDGDTITVYARGNGLAKIQIKDGKGLLSKVVDEYEIPSIKVIYTDNDNLNILGTSSDSSSEAAEAGKKAAEALNEILEAGE